MQNRYAGDIGDFIKLALLRKLANGRKLGIAWYLFPDEKRGNDGKHVTYLSQPQRWRHLDPQLFDALVMIANGLRSTKALEASGMVDAQFSGEYIVPPSRFGERSHWRAGWFERVNLDLRNANLIFADPDNGLVDDNPKRRSRTIFGKQIPLAEAKRLAEGRTAIVYHHNTRRKGGHDLEVDYWLSQFGTSTLAVRARAFSCRTFFILNPDAEVAHRARTFCDIWANHSVALHQNTREVF